IILSVLLIGLLSSNEDQIADKENSNQRDKQRPGKLTKHGVGFECLRERCNRAQKVQRHKGGGETEVLPDGAHQTHQLKQNGNDRTDDYRYSYQFLEKEGVGVRLDFGTIFGSRTYQ